MRTDAVISVWKDAGMTSHDVVAKVRRLIKQKRVGHAGTLDPDVTGVLLVCIGQATRLVERLHELPKTYVGEVTFGYATDSEDWTGQVLSQLPADQMKLNRHEMEKVMNGLIGPLDQIPPMVSAVRVDGKRLYEYARSGQVIERKARQVMIYDLHILDHGFDLNGYPTVKFEVTCSKGTYIRTLCVEMGNRLGVPAVMSHLTRTKVGHFHQSNSVSLMDLQTILENADSHQLDHAFHSILQALPDRPIAQLRTEQHLKWAKNGAQLPQDWMEWLKKQSNVSDEMIVVDENTHPIGIYQFDPMEQLWKADVIFNALNQ